MRVTFTVDVDRALSHTGSSTVERLAEDFDGNAMTMTFYDYSGTNVLKSRDWGEHTYRKGTAEIQMETRTGTPEATGGQTSWRKIRESKARKHVGTTTVYLIRFPSSVTVDWSYSRSSACPAVHAPRRALDVLRRRASDP